MSPEGYSPVGVVETDQPEDRAGNEIEVFRRVELPYEPTDVEFAAPKEAATVAEGHPAHSIVVGVDGSVPNRSAIRWAIEEAVVRGCGVDAIHATLSEAFDPDLPAGATEKAISDSVEMLRHAVEPLRPENIPAALTVRASLPVLGLVEEARSLRAPMLVVGRSGHGWLGRLLVGSVCAAVAHAPDRPLVVVPPDDPDEEIRPHAGRGKIVVGVDGTAQSVETMKWAIDEARRRGATIDAVMAWSMRHLDLLPFVPPPHASEPAVHDEAAKVFTAMLDEVAGEAGGVRIDRHLRHGDPVDFLLEAAEDADLVVVGTRGQGAIRQHVLGSTSHGLLHRCPAPLAIIPERHGAHQGHRDQR